MGSNHDLSIVERMKLLYSSGKWHDIEFHLKSNQTGENVVIGAHRLVLATCSPAFEALCFGLLADKKSVVLPDIEPDAFQALLKFLYTNTLELGSVEMVISLYYAANKYLLPSLMKLACNYLIANINEKNCFELYDMARIFEERALLEETFNYICSHLNLISKYVSCNDLSSDILYNLVNSPVLDADEIVLVQLCHMWAESACRTKGLETTGRNIRDLLTQCLIFQGIRWNLLREEDFTLVFPGVLSEEEITVLKHPDEFSALKVWHMPREKPRVKIIFIHRFLEKDMTTVAPRDGITVSTIITPNCSGILDGIFICCTVSLSSIMQLNGTNIYKERLVISVLDADGNLLCKEHVTRKEVLGEPFIVNLLNPVSITSGSQYDIRVQLLNPAHTYEFGSRNTCAKIPSGMSVIFKESADIHENGVFLQTSNFGVISGLKMSL